MMLLPKWISFTAVIWPIVIWPIVLCAAVWALAVWALKQDGDTSTLVRRLTGQPRLDPPSTPPA